MKERYFFGTVEELDSDLYGVWKQLIEWEKREEPISTTSIAALRKDLRRNDTERRIKRDKEPEPTPVQIEWERINEGWKVKGGFFILTLSPYDRDMYGVYPIPMEGTEIFSAFNPPIYRGNSKEEAVKIIKERILAMKSFGESP